MTDAPVTETDKEGTWILLAAIMNTVAAIAVCVVFGFVCAKLYNTTMYSLYSSHAVLETADQNFSSVWLWSGIGLFPFVGIFFLYLAFRK